MTEEQFLQMYSHVMVKGTVFQLVPLQELPTGTAELGLLLDSNRGEACLSQDTINSLGIVTEDNYVTEFTSGYPDFALGLVRANAQSIVHITRRFTNHYDYRVLERVAAGEATALWRQERIEGGLIAICDITVPVDSTSSGNSFHRAPEPAGSETPDTLVVQAITSNWIVFYPAWWTAMVLNAHYELPIIVLTAATPDTGAQYRGWDRIIDNLTYHTVIELQSRPVFIDLSHIPDTPIGPIVWVEDIRNLSGVQLPQTGRPALGRPALQSTSILLPSDPATFTLSHRYELEPGPTPDDPTALYQVRNPIKMSYGVGRLEDLVMKVGSGGSPLK